MLILEKPISVEELLRHGGAVVWRHGKSRGKTIDREYCIVIYHLTDMAALDENRWPTSDAKWGERGRTLLKVRPSLLQEKIHR